MEKLLIEIKEYINKNYWSFQVDLDEDNEYLDCSTREHGNVGDETYGEEDYRTALEIKQKVEHLWPQAECEVDTCDEWVNMNITIKEK